MIISRPCLGTYIERFHFLILLLLVKLLYLLPLLLDSLLQRLKATTVLFGHLVERGLIYLASLAGLPSTDALLQKTNLRGLREIREWVGDIE